MQDNLSTHNASAFYEQLPAAQAFALHQRFAFYSTPKSASWLNMFEIEFSALVKQCLGRRIPTHERWSREFTAIVKERNEKASENHWQFSIQIARTKPNTHYAQVYTANQQYKAT